MDVSKARAPMTAADWT